MLAPGGEHQPRPQGVVEPPPGVVEWRGAHAQAVGAEDPTATPEPTRPSYAVINSWPIRP